MKALLVLLAFGLSCSSSRSLEADVREYREHVCECTDIKCAERFAERLAHRLDEIEERMMESAAKNPLGLASKQDGVVQDMSLATACFLSLQPREPTLAKPRIIRDGEITAEEPPRVEAARDTISR